MCVMEDDGRGRRTSQRPWSGRVENNGQGNSSQKAASGCIPETSPTAGAGVFPVSAIGILLLLCVSYSFLS